MKKSLIIVVIVTLFTSCARSITPADAANRHYRNCRNIR